MVGSTFAEWSHFPRTTDQIHEAVIWSTEAGLRGVVRAELGREWGNMWQTRDVTSKLIVSKTMVNEALVRTLIGEGVEVCSCIRGLGFTGLWTAWPGERGLAVFIEFSLD